MAKSWICALAFSTLLAGFPAWGTVRYENTAKLRWKAVGKAKGYVVSLTRDGKSVLEKKIEGTALDTELEPGKYALRLRTVDAAGREGPWSKAREFVVKPGPPLPLAEQAREIAIKDRPVTATLGWDEADHATSYHLKIWKDGAVLREEDVSGSSAEVTFPEAGNYRYAVAATYAGLTGAFSPEFGLEVVAFKFASPTGLSPAGRIPFRSGKRLTLDWKKVPGAGAYQIELVRQKTWKMNSSVHAGTEAERPAAKGWHASVQVEDESGSGGVAQAAQGVQEVAVQASVAPGAVRAPASAETPERQSFVAETNSVTIDLPSAGTYTWKVRALADKQSRPGSGGVGPEAAAEVEVVRSVE